MEIEMQRSLCSQMDEDILGDETVVEVCLKHACIQQTGT